MSTINAVNNWLPGLWTLLAGVIIIAALLAVTTGMIWIERRGLAWFQDRLGPNRVGPFGLLQPVADVIKLFMKEDWIPPFADRVVFVLAPAILVISVLAAFAVVPFTDKFLVSDANVGVLFFLGMTSLGVYSITLAGWASNNKYSLVGGMRGAAQMISYELPMALSLAGVVILAGSMRLVDVVNAQTHLWYLPSAAARVHNFRNRRCGGVAQDAVRPARGRERACRRLSHRVFEHEVCPVLYG